jgi:AcrR family transcriptional regulator
MRRSQIPHTKKINYQAIPETTSKGEHSTRRTLIEVTSVLMDEKPLLQITSDQVLSASGVSKGSLYHFFADFDELLEVVQAERFSHWANALIKCVTGEFEKAIDKTSFILSLENVLTNNCCEKLKISPAELSRTLGFALGNERFSRNIIIIKERIRSNLLKVISDAIERSLPKKAKVNAENLALFIETWIFGRFAGEFYTKPVLDSQWENLSISLVNSLISQAA